MSVASRSAEAIIDLRENDKSRYFAIIDFNNCFTFDHQVCFTMNILRKLSDVPFSRKSDRKKEKSVVSFTNEQNIIIIVIIIIIIIIIITFNYKKLR